jgi:hypothetical protein
MSGRKKAHVNTQQPKQQTLTLLARVNKLWGAQPAQQESARSQSCRGWVGTSPQQDCLPVFSYATAHCRPKGKQLAGAVARPNRPGSVLPRSQHFTPQIRPVGQDRQLLYNPGAAAATQQPTAALLYHAGLPNSTKTGAASFPRNSTPLLHAVPVMATQCGRPHAPAAAGAPSASGLQLTIMMI